MKVSKNGGPSTPLYEGRQANSPYAIALDSTHVFWADWSGSVASVLKLPLQGGTHEILTSGQSTIRALAHDAINVYWAALGIRDAKDGHVVAVAKAGGIPLPLASNQDRPFGIAVDAENVFWTRGFGGVKAEVVRMPVAGGAATVLAGNQVDIRYLVADRTMLYWTTTGPFSGRGTVMKVAKTGGTPVQLAGWPGPPPYLSEPGELAVDDTHVYWVNFRTPEEGEVMKVPK